jgi:hypothetical protein
MSSGLSVSAAAPLTNIVESLCLVVRRVAGILIFQLPFDG